jgi:hypothetical protein
VEFDQVQVSQQQALATQHAQDCSQQEAAVLAWLALAVLQPVAQVTTW